MISMKQAEVEPGHRQHGRCSWTTLQRGESCGLNPNWAKCAIHGPPKLIGINLGSAPRHSMPIEASAWTGLFNAKELT